ncbi:MAG: Asp-tRNA(Asn)/Glu-tRNA(Gln) amidotransferase subunit GatB, partial [Planctomycetota bacterium]
SSNRMSRFTGSLVLSPTSMANGIRPLWSDPGAGELIVTEGGSRQIRLRRLHIEEDVGKNIHDEAAGRSLVDFNRAGTPLVEIVSEPDIASPEEARAYLNALRTLVQYLGISDANMQEGNLRCEPNVNLHVEHAGRTIETPIVEVKNLNSVRNVERALRGEVDRQRAEYERLGPEVAKLPRSTRGYDADRDRTYVLREKEEAHDYRYFPEPDIPPIHISVAWKRETQARVPELPPDRRRRFMREHGLSEYDADVLCRQRETADYFEEVVAAGTAPKPAANWILGEVSRLANERGGSVSALRLAPARLAALVDLVESGRIARAAAAREVLPRMLETSDDPAHLMRSLGLARLDDADLLRAAAVAAVQENPRAAADYRAGKKKALGALMGFVMRETKGKAEPDLVRRLLEEVLAEE